jgi:hypothetical protein
LLNIASQWTLFDFFHYDLLRIFLFSYFFLSLQIWGFIEVMECLFEVG